MKDLLSGEKSGTESGLDIPIEDFNQSVEIDVHLLNLESASNISRKMSLLKNNSYAETETEKICSESSTCKETESAKSVSNDKNALSDNVISKKPNIKSTKEIFNFKF